MELDAPLWPREQWKSQAKEIAILQKDLLICRFSLVETAATSS